MTRDRLADGVARRAKPCCAPFVPHTSCRHLPVECHILRPQRPSVQRSPKRLQPQQVRRNLQHNPLARCYETHMSKVLHEMGFKSDSLDQRLLSAWQHCASVTAIPSSSVAVGSQEIEGEQLKQQVHNMWAIRHSLRSPQPPHRGCADAARATVRRMEAGLSANSEHHEWSGRRARKEESRKSNRSWARAISTEL